MNEEYVRGLEMLRQQAIAELIGMIKERYPTASFSIAPGEDDPRGTHILAVVDTDDPDDATELTIQRELALQIDEGVPVYVIPIRTPERVEALMRQRDRAALPVPPAYRLA